MGEWEAGDERPQQLLDATRAEQNWRVSCIGPVAIELIYGTRATLKLDAWAPLVADIPGQVALYARPLDPSTPTIARCTLTPSASPGAAFARSVASVPGPLPDAAGAFFALTPSTLTVAGIPITVPALTEVPLVASSILNSGSGLLELAI
jgi:hypothetical protein